METPSLDPFVASGHPLHTRTLTVEATCSAAGRVRLDGVILDLRKCGFVPTGEALQTAGFIHHMTLSLELDAATARIEALDTTQPTVAFEPSAQSAGESCRDPARRLAALVGERIDADFVRRLGAVFGGALGCSHLLTLAQLAAASAPRFLAPESHVAERTAGEMIGKRVLFLDGFERPQGGLEVALQLSEFLTRPPHEARFALDHLLRQHELRLLARFDPGLSRVESLAALERTRDGATLTTAPWRDRADRVAALAGAPPLRGFAPRVLAALGDCAEDAPLRDALLNLAPGLIQCLAALSHRLVEHFAPGAPRAAGEIPRELSVGGYPDSCYMWRSGGAMARSRPARRVEPA